MVKITITSAPMEKYGGYLKNVELSYYPAILLLGINPKITEKGC